MTGTRFLLALLLLLSATALGQGQVSPVDDSNNPNKKTYGLTGTVVNAVTGEPVGRALVQVYAGGERSMLTGPDGHFEFTGLPAAQTAVNAQKPGFFSEDQIKLKGGWTPPSTIMIGPDTPAVTVRMVPESVIFGRVVANGEPVEGVAVKVMEAQIQDGRKDWAQPGAASTDDEGEFRIPNLMAGEYYLEIGPKYLPGGTATFKGHDSGYERVFYPSAPGLDGATPLVVGAGQRSEVEVSLKLEPWYRVSGMVRAGAEGANNTNVELFDGEGEAIEGLRLNPQTAEFEAHVASGTYMLHAQQFGPTGLAGSASVPVTVNADVVGMQVALGPAMTLPVRVKKEESGNVSAPHTGPVAYSGNGDRKNEPPPISMWLRWAAKTPGGLPNGGMLPNIGVDESGKPESFAVRNLMPGTYWMEMVRNPPWYVESAQCGNLDLLRETLTVGATAPCAAIDVVMRDDGATLKTSAQWDGDPAQAWVVTIPERAPGEATIMQMSRGDEVEMSDMAPGDYSLVLVDRVQGLEFKNPDAMSAYMGKAARVTLSANQKTSVTLELVRVGR